MVDFNMPIEPEVFKKAAYFPVRPEPNIFVKVTPTYIARRQHMQNPLLRLHTSFLPLSRIIHTGHSALYTEEYCRERI